MTKNLPMNEFPLLDPRDGIPLFYPYVPSEAIAEVTDTLSGRWIGQGPKVDLFEKKFEDMFLGQHRALAVGSGTDALHLAYLLADVTADDEVIVPVFTNYGSAIAKRLQSVVDVIFVQGLPAISTMTR